MKINMYNSALEPIGHEYFGSILAHRHELHSHKVLEQRQLQQLLMLQKLSLEVL